MSRQKIRKAVLEERELCGESADDEIVDRITERRLKEEIRSGIQTIQYQLITLMTCNGQAPFVTMFMYLDEVPEGRLRDDLASIIREVLLQRMRGVKNEKGVSMRTISPRTRRTGSLPSSRRSAPRSVSCRITSRQRR